jgi:hypothetical protein
LKSKLVRVSDAIYSGPNAFSALVVGIWNWSEQTDLRDSGTIAVKKMFRVVQFHQSDIQKL